ncbi:MAG: hypothetical protein ABI210_09300, partial [Abditibacteriaceae bacterium]
MSFTKIVKKLTWLLTAIALIGSITVCPAAETNRNPATPALNPVIQTLIAGLKMREASVSTMQGYFV